MSKSIQSQIWPKLKSLKNVAGGRPRLWFCSPNCESWNANRVGFQKIRIFSWTFYSLYQNLRSSNSSCMTVLTLSDVEVVKCYTLALQHWYIATFGLQIQNSGISSHIFERFLWQIPRFGLGAAKVYVWQRIYKDLVRCRALSNILSLWPRLIRAFFTWGQAALLLYGLPFLQQPSESYRTPPVLVSRGEHNPWIIHHHKRVHSR